MPPRRTQIDVKRLRFDFDDQWRAAMWDEALPYKEGIRRIDGAAVDLVAVRLDATPYLIEVKDPRGYATEFRRRATSVVDDVAEKVRDTIAGLVWAETRYSDTCHDKVRAVLFGGGARPKVHVVLWLEGVDPAVAGAIEEQIARKLRWLGPKVIVKDRVLEDRAPSPELAGLVVTSLPGAPAGRRR